MKDFASELKKRILVLDGALGTMIQKEGFSEVDFRGREFIHHQYPLAGFNDILNITKPSAIKNIHLQYLKAGANIITTNTFNSNKISMKDYGLDVIDNFTKRLNREGALLAREAITEFDKGDKDLHFVAGSIGPTNRSASMSPDITDPLKRNITYDQICQAYSEQIEGLIEGGVDLLICETFFDTLNLKAALDAASKIMNLKGKRVSVMVSATVSDNTGRILSGQTLEAFVTSISDYPNIISIGLNCGFGPDRIKEFLKNINSVNPFYTSCHPNAGLPDDSGCYNLSPEDFIRSMEPILKDKLVNIVGGCCGTTPEFIHQLSGIVKNYTPKTKTAKENVLRLAGLEMTTISDGFLTVGERCNVAGSSKFLRLIKEHSFEEAAEIAKKQVEKGAGVIDINMDDPLLDAEKEMVDFIRYISAEPDIAKVPFMIDSSKWNVIEDALKNIQGKGIVNSLSLKEGEEEFIRHAKRVKELGFALVVMAFDEKGQADTFDRKLEVCQRSYKILTEQCGYNPVDIIFDVNVMTIATGMKEHARYAIDFIETVRWIKKNLPGVRTSGGVSNLSFAFRGKNKLREFMHVIFLHHAKKAGLDMAIINPSQKTKYEDIPSEIRSAIEDVIFDRDEGAVERLVAYAAEDIQTKSPEKTEKKNDTDQQKRNIESILIEDLMKGELINLEEHVISALKEIKDPVKIIEGPLLEGMKRVGDLFGEGKMFLPQVVKTARSMKRAVEILTPCIEKSNDKADAKKNGKILIATVKGDVHDIGKNIVSTVLACNNYEIIDLGIMVDGEKIVETALVEKPDIICLSGLITPSLGEMTETVKLLKKAGIKVPIMVGGAATSLLHTALKIDPFYDGIVLHMSDASKNPVAASELLNPATKEHYLSKVAGSYKKISDNIHKDNDLVPYKEVLKKIDKKHRFNFDCLKPDVEISKPITIEIPLKEILGLINWKMFFLAWKMQGKYLQNFNPDSPEAGLDDSLTEDEKSKAREALSLYKVASEIITKLKSENCFDGKALLRFEKASADDKNLYIGSKEFPMLRQQRKDTDFLSCSDFISERGNDYIGLFAVTAGKKLLDLAEEYENNGDSYRSLVVQTLADRIVEASSEWLQKYVSGNYWNVSIRPAWGYPMLPDQTMILLTSSLLSYEEIGISLTENGAMYPPSSVSGLYFSNPHAKYFMVGEIGEDQIEDYAVRRGISKEKVKSLLRQL